MGKEVRVLFLGDVVGPLGMAMVFKHLPTIKTTYAIDVIVANGENSADGKGITPKIMALYRQHGIDVVTSGNHIWAKREIYSYLATHKDLLRPANFPSACPGVGVTMVASARNCVVAIVNLQGRVFMNQAVDCPFRAAESLLAFLKPKTGLVFVDFHAETTSEKMALGHFLDGKVTAVVGTHTHVQTADARILPKGTAFMTDLGMCGSLNSMIGMQKEPIITNFLTQMPQRFVVDDQPPAVLNGAVIVADSHSGQAVSIEALRIVDEAITMNDNFGGQL